MSDFLFEPPRQTPVAFEADLCVVGGSCTGVFAAVRAARLGLKVALVELNTIFGGMATAAQVNEWHSTRDAHFQQQIIGGLTLELMERLKKRGAVEEIAPPNRAQFRFNSAEMAVELDGLVREHKIRPFLSARCVGAGREENRLTHAIIEDKSGHRAVAARFFIDASGDGDLLRRAGFAAYKRDALQPVNLQATTWGYDGLPPGTAKCAIERFADEFGFPRANSSPWLFPIPGAPELRNVFGPRLNGVDASDADELTRALMESRRLHRALCEMSERESGRPLSLVGFAPALGVRETWHAECEHELRGDELLSGAAFPDAIARGTYPVDIHSPEGTILRYLDGREEVVARDGSKSWRRWREDNSATPPFYQVPLRALIPRDAQNLLIAGRLIDADVQAFGGVRVMVNCNQMGEAAGVAAFACLQQEQTPAELNVCQLRKTLVEGGSLLN